MGAKEFSLWITPSGSIRSLLRECVAHLGSTYGGSLFEPHVTILGQLQGIEAHLIAKTAMLAQQTAPFHIRLKDACYHNEYYKCVFLQVDKTVEIMDANRKAKEILRSNNDPPYYDPHLSLFYGTLSTKDKESIITNLDRFRNRTFVANNLQLISINGTTENWQKVCEFPLTR